MTTESLSLTPPRARLTTFTHAALFVLGFSAVFVFGWGGAATVLGDLIYNIRPAVAQVGGLIVIAFGIHTLGFIRIPLLDRDIRPGLTPGRGNAYLASGLMGVFFAAGWTPCIGTVLGAILTLSVNQPTIATGMVLSSGYALGLGLPFLAMGLFMDRSVPVLRQFRRHMRTVQIISGVLMIIMGGFLMTNLIFTISVWAQRAGFYIDLQVANTVTPTYAIAILGGLVSFLSPCVLPMVPAFVGYLGKRVAESA